MREFFRGAVQLHILHHVAHGCVYGAWMAEELARHGYTIGPGSLYPALHRMETGGLIRSRGQIAGGRTRRCNVAMAKRRLESKATRGQLRELAVEILGTELP